MSRLMRDRTAEPVSRETKGAKGDTENIFISPVQLTKSRIGNLTPLIHTHLFLMLYCTRFPSRATVYYRVQKLWSAGHYHVARQTTWSSYEYFKKAKKSSIVNHRLIERRDEGYSRCCTELLDEGTTIFLQTEKVKALLVCVCFLCFLPIHSGLQWTYQPGSHRKKVTQDFPSTFFLRCLP